MRPTVLFGGVNRERLVSVASAQAISAALPNAELWYWTAGGEVHAASQPALLAHQQPFEVELPPEGPSLGSIAATLERARREDRVLILALHGGPAENGELAEMCEARGVPFTGSGSAASRLAFDKARTKAVVSQAGVSAPMSVALEHAQAALVEHGRLVAKPVAEGSSFGLIFVNDESDLARLRAAAEGEAYLIEPFVQGPEATCGVLEHRGEVIGLPPVEIRPAGNAFDYASKYLATETEEICPATFPSEVNAAMQDAALKAHAAVGARGYSRSDFIITEQGPTFLEINTLPGLTRASLFPRELVVQGVAFADFLEGQIDLALRRSETAK
jgi:D-alanine-D-alanine ligase